MEQLKLPFQIEETIEELVDRLLEEQFRIRGRYVYDKAHLIRDIKILGRKGWAVNKHTGFILFSGKDVS